MKRFLDFHLPLMLSAILIVGSVGYWQYHRADNAFAAIGVDNVSTGPDVFASAATGTTWNHTVTSANEILIVGVTENGGGGFTSVTYNGTALTLIRTDIDNGNQVGSGLYYLVNPSVGTHSVVAKVSGGTVGQHNAAISLTGVDQVSPIDNNAGSGTSAKTTKPITVSIATNSVNAYVVDIFDDGDSGSNPVPGGSQISQVAASAGSSGSAIGMSTRLVPSATSVTNSWTLTQSFPLLTLSLVSLKAVASAAAVTPSFMMFNFNYDKKSEDINTFTTIYN